MNILTLGLAMNSVFGNLQLVNCQDPVLDLPCCELTVEEIKHYKEGWRNWKITISQKDWKTHME